MKPLNDDTLMTVETHQFLMRDAEQSAARKAENDFFTYIMESPLLNVSAKQQVRKAWSELKREQRIAADKRGLTNPTTLKTAGKL